jgi:hypothetical protein
LRRFIGFAELAFVFVAATSALGQIAAFSNLGWHGRVLMELGP